MRRSQAELARYLDLDPSSLTKTLKGDRRVQPAEVVKIERFFGDRLELDTPAQAPAALRKHSRAARVPVFGYGSPGADERILFGGEKVLEYLEPPPFWSGSGELIYVRVIGDSMSPRYRSGEIVPVRLELPPAKGQDCLIVFNDETAIVRTFQGERDGKVYVEQYGDDAKTYAIEATQVRARHAVWRPGMI